MEALRVPLANFERIDPAALAAPAGYPSRLDWEVLERAVRQLRERAAKGIAAETELPAHEPNSLGQRPLVPVRLGPTKILVLEGPHALHARAAALADVSVCLIGQPHAAILRGLGKAEEAGIHAADAAPAVGERDRLAERRLSLAALVRGPLAQFALQTAPAAGCATLLVQNDWSPLSDPVECEALGWADLGSVFSVSAVRGSTEADFDRLAGWVHGAAVAAVGRCITVPGGHTRLLELEGAVAAAIAESRRRADRAVVKKTKAVAGYIPPPSREDWASSPATGRNPSRGGSRGESRAGGRSGSRQESRQESGQSSREASRGGSRPGSRAAAAATPEGGSTAGALALDASSALQALFAPPLALDNTGDTGTAAPDPTVPARLPAVARHAEARLLPPRDLYAEHEPAGAGRAPPSRVLAPLERWRDTAQRGSGAAGERFWARLIDPGDGRPRWALCERAPPSEAAKLKAAAAAAGGGSDEDAAAAGEASTQQRRRQRRHQRSTPKADAVEGRPTSVSEAWHELALGAGDLGGGSGAVFGDLLALGYRVAVVPPSRPPNHTAPSRSVVAD
jgi:hypothetical protein